LPEILLKIKDVELENETQKKIELYNQTIKNLASTNFSEYNNLDFSIKQIIESA
jgi:hypothetical protein